MEKAFARIRHNLLTEVVSKKVRSKIVKHGFHNLKLALLVELNLEVFPVDKIVNEYHENEMRLSNKKHKGFAK